MAKRWIQSADVDISDSGALTVGTGKTYKRACGNANASGNNVIVAAVTGKKLCIISLDVMAKVAVDVTICSGTGNGHALSGVKALGANGGFVKECPVGDANAHPYETLAGESLNIYTSAANAGVSVEVVYYEE